MTDNLSSHIFAGLAPDPDIDLLKWADAYFYLPRESTSEHGKYRSSRTPFICEVLQELSPTCRTQEVVVMKPTQLAGTTAGIIFMLGSIDIGPGPGLCIQPTGDLARSFSKKKLSPTLDAVVAGSGRLAGKISDRSKEGSNSTILEKVFPGGAWRMAGSNSPAVYRSESVRYMILDDFDGFDADISGEGDPGELADRRTGSFSNRKIYKNSTPTTKGLSNIESAYSKSSQGKFCMPCPFCNEYQFFVFGEGDTAHGIKFRRDNDGQVVDAWYVCEHCGQRIDEHHKATMLPRGKYIHKFPDRAVRGFHYNALCTPLGWVNSWKKISQLFLDAAGNVEKLKVWKNTIMAEVFEEKGSRPPWVQIEARAETYKIMEVPESAYVLTSGVDVHDNRLDVVVRAWGREEESWLLYWTRIFGDVATPEPWRQLDTLLNTRFVHASGVGLRIAAMAVDSGDNTQIVYNYCRSRAPVAMAIYGSQKRGQPVLGRPTKRDVNYRGKMLKSGVMIWPVGTDSAKSIIYRRLAVSEPGAGCYHFPAGIDPEYYQQITAEKLVTTYDRKGFRKQVWHVVRGNRQNHALDAEVYCYAAAVRIGIDRINFDEIAASMRPADAGNKPASGRKKQRRVLSRGVG